jgi:hypothetical protein
VRQGLATPAMFQAGENFFSYRCAARGRALAASPAGPGPRSGFRFPLLIPQGAVGGHLSENNGVAYAPQVKTSGLKVQLFSVPKRRVSPVARV